MTKDFASSTEQNQPAGSASFSHSEIVRVMVGVAICILLAALDQTAVIPAVPAIGRDLNAYAQLSWIVAAYLIASTISTPLYAKLSDVYGRRKLLIACLIAFIATSVLCGSAQSLAQLVWFRALQGLGGGGLVALTQAVIADVVSPRERGRYQGYISAVWASASLSGPILGGLVAQSASWRWIFWVNLPIGAVALWICRNSLRRLPAPVHETKPRLDLIGMTLLSGALSVLLLALGWGGSHYAWNSFEILGLFTLGVVLLLSLFFCEQRASDPLLPPRVFRNSSFVSNVAISTLTSVVVFMCLFTIPLYFQMARSASASESGAFVAPFMLSSALGNILGSKWAQHFGTMRGGLRLGSALAFTGLAYLAWLPVNAPVWAVILGMVITGLGVGICLIGSITSAQNCLSSGDIGAGTGAVLVLRSVGGASGSTLAGAIIALRRGEVHQRVEIHASTSGVTLQHGTVMNDAAHSALATAVSVTNHSFGLVYALAGAFAAFAFMVTLRMPNVTLKGAIRTAHLID